MRWLSVLFLLVFSLVPSAGAQAFPAEEEWIPVMLDGQPLWDPYGDAGGNTRRDIVGEGDLAAGYYFRNNSALYLRMRIATGPEAGQKFHPSSGWGVALEYDGDYGGYEAMVWLDGGAGQVQLYANTVTEGNGACDVADRLIAYAPSDEWARLVAAEPESQIGGNQNYYIDFAVPTSALESMPAAADGSRPLPGTPMQFIFGTGANATPQFVSDIAGSDVTDGGNQLECGLDRYLDVVSDDTDSVDEDGDGLGDDWIEPGEGDEGTDMTDTEAPRRIVADTPEEAAAMAEESARECLWVLDPDYEGEGTAYICDASWVGGGAVGCTSAGNTGGAGMALAAFLFLYLGLARRRRVVWLLPLLVWMPIPVWGMDTERYQATPSPTGWIAVDQFDVLEQGDMSAGFFPRFAKDPVVYRDGGTITRRVVSGRLSGDLVGAVGVFPRVEIGVGIPAVFYQTGEGFLPDDAAVPPAVSLGDIRLRPRIALLTAADTGADWGLSFTPALHLPTSREGALAGAGGVGFHPELAAGGRVGPWALAANLGAAIRRSQTTWGVTQGSKLLYKAAVGWKVPGDRGVVATAEILGETAAGDPFSAPGQNPLEWMGGAMGQIMPGLTWHGGVGTGLLPGIGSPTFRMVAGIRWTTGNTTGPFVGEARTTDGAALAAIRRDRIELEQTVNFYSGQEVINPDSYDLLDAVADILRQNRRLRVRIVGHTDNVGDAAMNQELSLQRARSVANYLVGQGIDAERMEVEGRGESEPIADNATPQGREQNRRVEFLVE